MKYLKCWRSISRLAGAIVASAILTTTTAAPRRAAPPAGNLFVNPLWDDGRAEFSTLTGTTSRYGQTRATEARLIVVKEDLLRGALVKSDAGPVPGRTVEAIKLNFVADFQTGVYTYHQMASVFFNRRTLEVLKEVTSHTEACGITYVRVGPENGRWMHHAHSYWEGEADREVPLAWPADGEHLFWDALPVSLRQYVHAGREPFDRDIWVLPTQLSGRSPIESTRPVHARLSMRSGGTLEVPAGRFTARRFDLVTPKGTDTFWFDERPPYLLLRVDTAAGRHLALKQTLRLDYWNHHMNGDEKVLSGK